MPFSINLQNKCWCYDNVPSINFIEEINSRNITFWIRKKWFIIVKQIEIQYTLWCFTRITIKTEAHPIFLKISPVYDAHPLIDVTSDNKMKLLVFWMFAKFQNLDRNHGLNRVELVLLKSALKYVISNTVVVNIIANFSKLNNGTYQGFKIFKSALLKLGLKYVAFQW